METFACDTFTRADSGGPIGIIRSLCCRDNTTLDCECTMAIWYACYDSRSRKTDRATTEPLSKHILDRRGWLYAGEDRMCIKRLRRLVLLDEHETPECALSTPGTAATSDHDDRRRRWIMQLARRRMLFFRMATAAGSSIGRRVRPPPRCRAAAARGNYCRNIVLLELLHTCARTPEHMHTTLIHT